MEEVGMSLRFKLEGEETFSTQLLTYLPFLFTRIFNSAHIWCNNMVAAGIS